MLVKSNQLHSNFDERKILKRGDRDKEKQKRYLVFNEVKDLFKNHKQSGQTW